MMKKISTLLLFVIFQFTNGKLDEDYWSKRLLLKQKENNQAFGGMLSMSKEESLANEVLMEYKRKEIDEAFRYPEEFPPSRNFMEARDDIEKSKVFKIIKKMPKGAVLHAHDTAIVSDDWVFNNITYRDNLYICQDNNDFILQFFENPTSDCHWQLLSELRKNRAQATDINAKIRQKLSMVTADPNQAYPTVNDAWQKFGSIFEFIAPLLSYRPVFRDYFYHGLEELYEDNVLYIEFRTALFQLYELNGTEYDIMESIKIYKEVTNRFRNEHADFVGVKIIYSPNKHYQLNNLQKMIDLTTRIVMKYPEFIAGLDLVGQEDPSIPIKNLIPKFAYLINKVKFFFHAGETNWYDLVSDENLFDAILLNTTRIGHGYAVVKHPEVLKEVKDRNIPIEICPISNQVLGLVKDLRNHPANILFASNFPLVISNDDPGLWGSKALSYDFYEAFMGMMSREADIRALKQLAINSINYSSMNEYQKIIAQDIWERKWTHFVTELSNEDPNN